MDMFNLKSKDNQLMFHEKTQNAEYYVNCFNNDQPIKEQAEEWKKLLFSDISDSFRKIRITGKFKESEASDRIKK